MYNPTPQQETYLVNLFTRHERTKTVKQHDLIDVGELNCLNCGMPALVAICPEHGEQENATLQDNELLCIEWDFGHGDECWNALTVTCSECGGNTIEGIDEEEDEDDA